MNTLIIASNVQSAHHDQMLGPARPRSAVRQMSVRTPIMPIRRGPRRSIAAPMNGARITVAIAGSTGPNEICARVQPNARSNGSKNRPAEYTLIVEMATPAVAASTTGQCLRHSDAASPFNLIAISFLSARCRPCHAGAIFNSLVSLRNATMRLQSMTVSDVISIGLYFEQVILKAATAMPTYDSVIKGGTIIDGLQTPRYRADIGIVDGKVVEISSCIAANRAVEVI